MEEHTMDAGAKTNGRQVTGATLKMIAIITMLIDHIGAFLVERYMEQLPPFQNADLFTAIQNGGGRIYLFYFLLRMIGRLGFPLFCFLLVEGFEHTRSRLKYALRLLAFCFISEIPFDLAYAGEAFHFQYQNVYFTLFIGFLVMWGLAALEKGLPLTGNGGKICNAALACVGALAIPLYFGVETSSLALPEQIQISRVVLFFAGFLLTALVETIVLLCLAHYGKIANLRLLLSQLAVLVLGMAVADLLRTDYSHTGVLTLAVMYRLRGTPVKQITWGSVVLLFSSIVEATALLCILPVRKYNGSRGRQNKYAFYIFYPAHLLVLYLIAKMLGWV